MNGFPLSDSSGDMSGFDASRCGKDKRGEEKTIRGERPMVTPTRET